MVLARVANYLFPSETAPQFIDDGREGPAHQYQEARRKAEVMEQEDLEESRPPYLHSMLAGGLGGTTGDMLMHSLDTVKTRQQGDPHMPPKYTSMGSTYHTIWRQEGVRRGLYSGVTPAFLGSFSGTVIFFGMYEWSKRKMIDAGLTPGLAYLSAGFVADLAASPLYVPSEVLKTRLQLQGRYNNPYFHSGYNYRSTLNAARTIARVEGFSALFYGYKATLFRDLPFSALQFAFYEQEQKLAKAWVGSNDIGLPLQILTGASAGGMAGVITCPLDVVKTRIQTQLNPDSAHASAGNKKGPNPKPVAHHHASTRRPTSSSQSNPPLKHARPISTSGPSTALRQHGSVTLDTSSVFTGLKMIYKTEGIAGWFRGVGPRAVWTSVQSGTMLVMYQVLLKYFQSHPLIPED
ncbi:mitochondrial carrier protein [Cryomyces antarcticus]